MNKARRFGHIVVVYDLLTSDPDGGERAAGGDLEHHASRLVYDHDGAETF